MIVIKNLFYGIETIGKWKGKLCYIVQLQDEGQYKKTIEQLTNRILNESLKTGCKRFVIFGEEIDQYNEIYEVIENVTNKDESIKFIVYMNSTNEINVLKNVSYVLEVSKTKDNEFDTFLKLSSEDRIKLVINSLSDFDLLNSILKTVKNITVIITQGNITMSNTYLTDYVISNNLNNVEIGLFNYNYFYPRHISNIQKMEIKK